MPAHPTSTVVTPKGGVVGFSATATDLYVDTGTRLVTYTTAGTTVSSFALPAGFTGSAAEVSEPVVDPTGDIYLSSYYGTAVDKFSPAGALLWSVDPGAGNPTDVFAVGSGTGCGGGRASCRTRRRASSSTRTRERSPAASRWWSASTASSPPRATATSSTRPTGTSRR